MRCWCWGCTTTTWNWRGGGSRRPCGRWGRGSHEAQRNRVRRQAIAQMLVPAREEEGVRWRQSASMRREGGAEC